MILLVTRLICTLAYMVSLAPPANMDGDATVHADAMKGISCINQYLDNNIPPLTRQTIRSRNLRAAVPAALRAGADYAGGADSGVQSTPPGDTGSSEAGRAETRVLRGGKELSSAFWIVETSLQRRKPKT